jgi:hypothetical protein
MSPSQTVAFCRRLNIIWYNHSIQDPQGDNMQAVEFEAAIQNGTVHIPKQYKALQQQTKATFIVMYEPEEKPLDYGNNVEEELDKLFAQSNNSVQVTMKNITQTDGMISDGIF